MVEARDNLNDLKTKFTPIMKHRMEAIVISEVLSAVFTGTALTGGNTTGWMLFVSTQQTGARDGAAVSSTGVNDSSRFQTSSWTIQPWLSNDLYLLQVD